MSMQAQSKLGQWDAGAVSSPCEGGRVSRVLKKSSQASAALLLGRRQATVSGCLGFWAEFQAKNQGLES